ncbi:MULTISPECIES: PL29 family lyase N-terminal domain-containing protein [Butyricimonas]|uniref:PL29 family lyase N-terminal domain-containing protein n=1 Tax=Butyricimonas TaxID=574697 RepID=UPI0007FB5973|nr:MULTISPECIES: hypothetical protein [Butyricimonas]
MNRKWNYAKKAFFGMLVLGLVSPSFVGCKDYDDDIDDLQQQITENKEAIEANKKAIADIQSAVAAGAVLVDVQETSNGIVVKLSDGKSYTITNGKNGEKGEDGEKGTDAPIPTFAIEDGKLVANYTDGTKTVLLDKVFTADDFEFTVNDEGHLILNGTEDLGKVTGENGIKGDDGLTPEIKFEGSKLVITIGEGENKKVIEKDLMELLNGSETNPALAFSVGTDGYLYVNDTKTDALIYNVYMVREKNSVKIYMPEYEGDAFKLDDAGKIAYGFVEIPTNAGGQVTSVTLVPMRQGGDLKVYKLWNIAETPKSLDITATSSQLRFQVNPTKAQLGEDKDFVLLPEMKHFKLLSRATPPKFLLSNPVQVKEGEETGLVYADFKFENVAPDAQDIYTLAAGIKNNHTGEVIYSDYIEFNPQGHKVQPLFVQLIDKKDVEIAAIPELELIREMGKSLDVVEHIFVKAKEGDKYNTLESYGFAAPTFEVKEVKAESTAEDVLAVNGTTISVKDVTFKAQGATITFEITAKVKDNAGKDVVLGKQKIQVKIVEDVEELNLIEDIVVNDFNGSAKTIAENVLKAGAINQFNTYFNVDVTTDEKVKVAFEIKKNGKVVTEDITMFEKLSAKPEIKVNPSAQGVYEVKMTVTREVSETVVVTSVTNFTITVNPIKFLEGWKEATYWNAGDAITVKVDKSSENFKSDLQKLFNIDNKLGVKVKYTNKVGEKNVSVNGDEAILTENAAKNLAMAGTVSGKIVAQLVNATDETVVLDTKEITVTFENPFKSFTVSGEDKLSLLDATFSSADEKGVDLNINKLLTLSLKADNREGSIVDLITKSEKEETLDLNQLTKKYGTEKIEYSLKDNKDSRISITESGVLTWKNTGVALAQDVKVVVVITIKNNWKPITEEVTVTIKKN